MKTEFTKEVKTTVVVSTTTTCNMCGLTMNDKDLQSPDMHSFKLDYGYGSKRDGDIEFFDLCEDCISNITKNFKHPAKVKRSF